MEGWLSQWRPLAGPLFWVWAEKALRALITVIVSWLVLRFGNIFIDRLMARPVEGKFIRFEERRVKTLTVLSKSVLRYTVDVLAALVLLQIFAGPEVIGPLLASAGIAGVAIGFGAKNLVQDVITGFFIIFEDQFAVGDYVTTAGVSGTVEEMGLRVTKLRDFGGEVHIVPNGKIDKVTNHSRGKMRALVDVRIAYVERLDRVIPVLEEVAREVAAAMPDVVREGPEVQGVVEFGTGDMTLRVVAQTVPMTQWRVERELRRRIKEAFDREGIEMPRGIKITESGASAR
ncbi:MAG: mechanosensitive ion channel family protein [Actinobacteria bacterium]|nr:mechanosensitive ion channel family protein [Actinomycetota bacterium]